MKPANACKVWQLSGLIAQRLSGSVLGVAIDDGPYLALAELAGWRRAMVLVPLDPHDPVSRLCHVAKESQASCLVAKDWGDAKTLASIPILFQEFPDVQFMSRVLYRLEKKWL